MQMRVLQIAFLLACIGATAFHTYAPAQSARPASIDAHISFETAIDAGKDADVAFAGVQTRPADKVTLEPSGSMRLQGHGVLLRAYGQPAIVTFGDTRGEIINVLPGNYTLVPGIASLQARCRIKGVEENDCETLPISGKKENTLFIGMDLTAGDGSISIDNAAKPAFDISIVFQ